MKVTSIHHMYPGTKVYTVCNPLYGKSFIEPALTVLSWPKEKFLSRFYAPGDCFLGWYVEASGGFAFDGIAFLADYGMGPETFGNVSFTTRKEAEEYLEGIS